ncbi:MAG: hypothetical protein A0129_02315 [Limnobacter sp. CACIAM 66H1]|nr:MAG: hypothetical protein A0129_02315 [Limnobacter sp. CACIAM 66H1]
MICIAQHYPAKIQVEFPAFDSGSVYAKRQSVFASTCGRPSLRIKPGDLILNRRNDATLLQITQATSTSTIMPRRSGGQQKTRSEFQ